MTLSQLEDGLTLAGVSQVPGKRGWGLSVRAISALVEDVVNKRWGIVGFIQVEVDFAVRCFLCCVGGKDSDQFVSSCDRHCVNSSSDKL